MTTSGLLKLLAKELRTRALRSEDLDWRLNRVIRELELREVEEQEELAELEPQDEEWQYTEERATKPQYERYTDMTGTYERRMPSGPWRKVERAYRTPSGNLLTDEDIERLSDEAEKGYEIPIDKASQTPELPEAGVGDCRALFKIGQCSCGEEACALGYCRDHSGNGEHGSREEDPRTTALEEATRQIRSLENAQMTCRNALKRGNLWQAAIWAGLDTQGVPEAVAACQRELDKRRSGR